MTQAPPQVRALLQCLGAGEALPRLESLVGLCAEWSAQINLIGPATREALWERHILDSLQLSPWIRPGEPVLDFGSGAGFPALVLAAAGAGPVTAVEADQRKSAFLRLATARLALPVTVLSQRLERLQPMPETRWVTARACAALSQLLAWQQRLAPQASMLALKGRSWQGELQHATSSYRFAWHAQQSVTEPEARLLHLTRIDRI